MTRSARLRDCVCTRDIVVCRAAGMDAWKDELASWQTDELSPPTIWRRERYGTCTMTAMQALSHHVCLDMCSILVDIAGTIGSKRLANHGQA